MRKCATEGPIIVVNVTDLRSDALVLTATFLEAISLPQLSSAEASTWLKKDWTPKSKRDHCRVNKEFLAYLSWLWHACVKHVLASIAVAGTEQHRDLARVWWIGCGLASSMPFHAAGLHDHNSKENAYSQVVSSYTPSVKALHHARRQAEHIKQDCAAQEDMLIVGMPTTPKGRTYKKAPKALRGVYREMDAIKGATPPSTRMIALLHPTAEQILEALQRSHIAHSPCRGVSDTRDAAQSGLILQRTGVDGMPEQDFLSAHRILESHLRRAQIAYLSACSTAENKAERLRDEVIYVVSGFRVAGCLWPAGDTECVEVAKEFYGTLFAKSSSALCGDDAALALQEAVMRVRAEDISMPLNWAQFVHFRT